MKGRDAMVMWSKTSFHKIDIRVKRIDAKIHIYECDKFLNNFKTCECLACVMCIVYIFLEIFPCIKYSVCLCEMNLSFRKYNRIAGVQDQSILNSFCVFFSLSLTFSLSNENFHFFANTITYDLYFLRRNFNEFNTKLQRCVRIRRKLCHDSWVHITYTSIFLHSLMRTD